LKDLPVLRDIVRGTALIAITLIVWQGATEIVRSPFFPSPVDVVRAFVRIATIGDIEGITLLDHSVASVLRVLVGFGLACVTGIPAGVIMGLKREIYDATKAIIEPVRFIPPIAWVPLAIILLTGYSRYILIIWLGAFFPGVA